MRPRLDAGKPAVVRLEPSIGDYLADLAEIAFDLAETAAEGVELGGVDCDELDELTVLLLELFQEGLRLVVLLHFNY